LVGCCRTLRYWLVAFGEYNPSGAKFPKFHSLLHFYFFTKECGAPALTYGGWWEQAHTKLVKLPYLRTGRRVEDLYRLLVLRTALCDAVRQKTRTLEDGRGPDLDAGVAYLRKKRRRYADGSGVSALDSGTTTGNAEYQSSQPVHKRGGNGYLTKGAA